MVLLRMHPFGMFIKIVFVLNHYRQIANVSLFFFTLGNSVSFLEKANTMILTKGAADKNSSMKSQLLLSSNKSDEKLSGERVWRSEGYFSDIRPELNLQIKSIPENTFSYVNHSYLLTIKNGDIPMYNHNFTLGQIIVVTNRPDNIEIYICKQNQLKLTTCIYDLATGEFQDLKSELEFIVLQGDSNEIFFS